MLEFFLKNVWRWACGLPEEDWSLLKPGDDLSKSEWSDEFEQLMRRRLVMGALRYGKINAPGKPNYDRTVSIEKRISLYRQTGNTEFLVDCANLCLLEFVEGDHPNKNFQALYDSEHVKPIQ